MQVIAYAKGQSHIIPKLRGTFEPPTTTGPVVETTALQKSIFNAPPSGIPSKPIDNGLKPANTAAATEPHGIKRAREEEGQEEEEDENEVEMEEDEDDAPMEEDEDD